MSIEKSRHPNNSSFSSTSSTSTQSTQLSWCPEAGLNKIKKQPVPVTAKNKKNSLQPPKKSLLSRVMRIFKSLRK